MGSKLLINNTDELYLWSHETQWMTTPPPMPSYLWVLMRLRVGKTGWSHFTEEKTEVKGQDMICLRSPSYQPAKQVQFKSST